MSVRRAPHRAQPGPPPRTQRSVAVTATPAETRTVLRQEVAPRHDERQQPLPNRWPSHSWVRPTQHPFDLAQVRFHTFPQEPPQPLVHSAPPQCIRTYVRILGVGSDIRRAHHHPGDSERASHEQHDVSQDAAADQHALQVHGTAQTPASRDNNRAVAYLDVPARQPNMRVG